MTTNPREQRNNAKFRMMNVKCRSATKIPQMRGKSEKRDFGNIEPGFKICQIGKLRRLVKLSIAFIISWM